MSSSSFAGISPRLGGLGRDRLGLARFRETARPRTHCRCRLRRRALPRPWTATISGVREPTMSQCIPPGVDGVTMLRYEAGTPDCICRDGGASWYDGPHPKMCCINATPPWCGPPRGPSCVCTRATLAGNWLWSLDSALPRERAFVAPLSMSSGMMIAQRSAGPAAPLEWSSTDTGE